MSKLVDEGGELFAAATFILFGAVILGPVLDGLTWHVVLYAVVSLTVVRMLPVALAVLGTGAVAGRWGSWAGSGRAACPTANPLTEQSVCWWTSHPPGARPAMESVPAGERRAGPGG